MLFIPYRFSADLRIPPILTILVSVVCLVVYAAQSSRESEIEHVAVSFCKESLNSYEQMMMKNVAQGSLELSCPDVLLSAKVA